MTARRKPGTAQAAQESPITAAGAILRAEMPGSVLEAHLLLSVLSAGLPEPAREYRFDPARRWRADFAWVGARLLVEVEGGVYRGGGHRSIAGVKRDIEKYNAMTLGGWRLLRFHGDQVRSGEAVELIRRALEVEP